MRKVKHILKTKGGAVWGVTPQASVYDALCLMAEKNVGAVMVVDAGAPVGIFTERDYARKIILHGRHSRDIPVHEVMTTALISVNPHQTTEKCMALMTRHHIRHLPVMDGGRLAGLISMRDVVESIITEQEDTIDKLQSVVQGDDPGI